MKALAAVLLCSPASAWSLWGEDEGVRMKPAKPDDPVYMSTFDNLAGRPVRTPTLPHADGVEVVDYSTPQRKLKLNGRVIDLVHGEMFDDIMRDTPDELRPGSVIAFYRSATGSGAKDRTTAENYARSNGCRRAYAKLGFESAAESALPARERLAVFRYDMDAAPHRAWYKFTPERDLAKRFGVVGADGADVACPMLVYAPPTCNGFTKWCLQSSKTVKAGAAESGESTVDVAIDTLGCASFDEQCVGRKSWSAASGGSWKQWTLERIAETPWPKLSSFLGSYKAQGHWIKSRDSTTQNTHMRNMYLAKAFPAFTPTGFRVIDTPVTLQKELMAYWHRHVAKKKEEGWDIMSQTQMNFHENKTDMVTLDYEPELRDRLANEYLKPLCEEWSKMAPLHLTAFYGIRMYRDGAWLRGHIDRIDTHVISVTMSLAKLDENLEVVEDDLEPWPLEVTDWKGDNIRYAHPQRTTILYESSKLIHGRPYRNPKKGGWHLGVFAHFKPDNANFHTEEGKDAITWDAAVEMCRRESQTDYTFNNWRASRSVGPEHGKTVYAAALSKKVYGKAGEDGEEESDEPADSGGRFDVTFTNMEQRCVLGEVSSGLLATRRHVAAHPRAPARRFVCTCCPRSPSFSSPSRLLRSLARSPFAPPQPALADVVAERRPEGHPALPIRTCPGRKCCIPNIQWPHVLLG